MREATGESGIYGISCWASRGHAFSQRILLGSTVVGMVLALVSGWMAYRLFLRRETRAVVSRGS